jgi:hypothetical protein
MLPLIVGLLAAHGGPPRGSEQVANVCDQVLGLFDRHPLVALAEHHRNVEFHQFLRALIQRKGFSSHVRDIVVEFGTAKYQSTADAYVDGKAVSREQLAHVWRDTGQMMPWDVPVYSEFFATVRSVNRGLPPNQRIRVHLGDPPVDWPNVKSASDYVRYAKRDTFYFKLVDRLLAEHRKALLIYGGAHLYKRNIRGPDAPPSPVEPLPDLADRYGEKLVCIWTLVGPSEIWKPSTYPAFTLVAGEPIGDRSAKYLLPRGIKFLKKVNGKAEFVDPDPKSMPTVEKVMDAILAISPRSTEQEPSLDEAKDGIYLAELRRRAAILGSFFGMDFLPEVEASIKHRGSDDPAILRVPIWAQDV